MTRKIRDGARRVLDWSRTRGGVMVWALVICAVVLGMLPHDAHAAGSLLLPLFVGAIGNPIEALTYEELQQISEPERLGQGETIPGILWDSQTYTSAATTTLTFFAGNQVDPTLGNVNGGSLPDPQWFRIWKIGFDILADATTDAGAETGAIDNIAKLMMVGRPTFNLTISNKNYGPWPLSFLHTSGGAWGVGWGTFTAEESIQYATNSYPDGGWDWCGSVVIPPKVNFNVVINWAAAQTLSGGNPIVRFWMSGALARKVL